MAYVTRVRRERVSVDELVRRAQAEEETRRAAAGGGAHRVHAARVRRRCRLVAFGAVVVFLASFGRPTGAVALPDVRPIPPATAAGR
ncbi:hypothetical protein [Amycolatopsis tolypomycina]|uniref:Uncharacterized protein n=1 Tax=Amycolatopsis tolypomycina TaxID=208445 RepID=A0A1H4SR46_9PSEU|nr:hypothetical protein [Amycolatopsis tolypomycina]SEC46488.1 hypothetical protein SAMN04489727_3851 [Amycolatopsis tolypomycina]